jgi:hypothetical protein
MYPYDYRPRGSLLRPLLVALVALGVLGFVFFLPQRPVISSWVGAQAAFQVKQVATVISAAAAPVGNAPAAPGIVGEAVPQTIGLERYNAASQQVDVVADGLAGHYRRTLPSGATLVYFVVQLGPRVHIEVLNADGATPGSDPSGDTVWTDGKQHLATVAEMVAAPYALRDGKPPLAAMAFGFHGAARTSDEGTVVINGTVHRVNAGRAALCITPDNQARLGLFDAAALKECAQANGAGPIILLAGKVANPAADAPSDTFVPFNPLNEDFVQLDWRKKIYTGTYPKTAVGVGTNERGAFVVFATSYGATGLELAGQLKAMGCTDALGGDDDTSTQAVWRGQPAQPGSPRKVPDALAVYVRE